MTTPREEATIAVNQPVRQGVNGARLDDDLARRLERMSPAMVWAFHWAAQGWPVLPCWERCEIPHDGGCKGKPGYHTKAPLIAGGKNNATTDPSQIMAWWVQWPDAMIGGRTDGLVVLDCDAYKTGHSDDLASLGELPPTRTFSTPGQQGVRGRHLVFRDPAGQCRSTKAGRNKTIDVRAGTSKDYVILPPSESSAGVYKVLDWRSPASAPAAVLQLADGPPVNAKTAPDEGLPPYEDVPAWAPVAWIRKTGCADDPGKRSEHTWAFLGRCRKAKLTPGQARTLAEDDPITRDRIAESKRSNPAWWPREFWSCWNGKEEMQDDEEKPGKPTAKDNLTLIARRDFEFGLLTGEVPYFVRRDGPNVARAFGLKGGFRSQMSRAHEREFGFWPNQSALTDVLTGLEAEAAEGRTPVRLPLRVAEHNGKLVLDLGREDGKVIVIGPEGWEVAKRSPVLFLRTALTTPLPVPAKGGSLRRHLFPLVNLPDQGDQALVTATMLSWLWPDISHPVLYFRGEEGSAKSTAARLLRRLVDPSAVEVRRQPGRDEDFEISIQGQWGVILDNLSSISEWLSDAICMAVTGTGDVKRKKYADQELSILQFRRCFILTSIPPLLDRGDLVERTIPVEFLPIEGGKRKTDTEIDREWEAAWSLALGALLDLAVKVMPVLPDVPQAAYDYRMADFAKIAWALDKVAGTRAHPRYLEKLADSVHGALEADPFMVAIVELAGRGKWESTVAELHAQVVARHLTTGTREFWPKGPKQTSDRLRRASGMLRKGGVSVTFPPRTRKGQPVIIEPIGDDRGPV